VDHSEVINADNYIMLLKSQQALC